MDEERDFITEVREKIEDYLTAHEDGFVPGVAAYDLGSKWQQADPELLQGWLMSRWPSLLTEYISTVSRQRAGRSRRARVHAVFGAIDQANTEEDREAACSRFYEFYEVKAGESKVRKALHAMTAGEVGQVSEAYRQRSRDNLLYACIMDSIQVKVADHGPDATVSSVFTPEQLQAMFEHS
jgi:hypothetical protein